MHDLANFRTFMLFRMLHCCWNFLKRTQREVEWVISNRMVITDTEDGNDHHMQVPLSLTLLIAVKLL